MPTDFRHNIGQRLSDPMARLIAKTRVHPNVLTIIGFTLNIGVAILVAMEYLFIGGFLLIFSGLFDMLDGAVARITGKTSKFGAILDSTLDRFSEAAVLFGLLIYYLYPVSTEAVLLIFAILVGSIIISYVRAKAESLGLKCEVGLFTRPERVILLAIGLIFNQLLIYILWIMAIGTNLTALWRMLYVRHQTGKTENQGTGAT